ncbi:MAG TPA: FAD-dependent oxidoreductase, partial [Armatimonadota bacterium]|nr:FAD-dependent oxidoreductase [Armatimonadota bacterium]
FSAVIDRARIWTTPDTPRPVVRGSILEFVGTDVPVKDEEIAAQAVRIAEQMFPRARSATIVKIWAHRSKHDEYFEVLPGTEADRPAAATPITNLFVAGDFTAHAFGNVGMEGAVVSGMEAANRVLSACGWQSAAIEPLAAPGRFVKLLRWVLQQTGTFSWWAGYEQYPCATPAPGGSRAAAPGPERVQPPEAAAAGA